MCESMCEILLVFEIERVHGLLAYQFHQVTVSTTHRSHPSSARLLLALHPEDGIKTGILSGVGQTFRLELSKLQCPEIVTTVAMLSGPR